MLTFVLVCIACAVFAIITFVLWTHGESEFIPICFGAMSLLCFIAIVIMTISIVVNNSGISGLIAANQQRYESLVYQLENDIYDNDNDLGKKELYNQIQAWNEDLAKGKALQHDIWVGIFWPDIYDQFEFIELS